MPDICVHCGRFATTSNKEGQPTCVPCSQKAAKRYVCSKCKSYMEARKGKFGSFWGCSNFPMCDHTVSLKKAFMKEKSIK